MWCDLLNGLCYAGAGLFLLRSAFSYTAYLAFSLLVSCLAAFDELAYNSFYPLLLPEGQEERAYTVSAMLLQPVVIAVFVGYWAGLDSNTFTVNAACGVYLWMLSLLLFYNAYRGHIAYSKCVTNPFAFLGLILKNPLNLIVKSLPDDYKVGEV